MTKILGQEIYSLNQVNICFCVKDDHNFQQSISASCLSVCKLIPNIDLQISEHSYIYTLIRKFTVAVSGRYRVNSSSADVQCMKVSVDQCISLKIGLIKTLIQRDLQFNCNMRTLVSYIHEHKSQVSIARALSKVLYMSTIRANICGKSRVKCSVEVRTKPGTNKQSPQFSI